MSMQYLESRNMWKGICPRCGLGSFFAPLWQHSVNDTSFSAVECPGEHMFIIEADKTRKTVFLILPIEGECFIPDWLPDIYKNAYGEMMFDYHSHKYRSASALARIILDAYINDNIKNPGEKRKSLKERLELLAKNGLVDHDQFAEGTITRLGGNDVIHPEDLSKEVTKEDADDVIGAVTRCLGRHYQYRAARSLPTPEDEAL